MASAINRFEEAVMTCEQALQIFQDLEDQLGERQGLILLGRIALLQQKIEVSKNYYQQAQDLKVGGSQPRDLLECWIGLAQISIEEGNLVHAERLAQKIRTYLEINPYLHCLDNPIRILFFIWQIMGAVNQNSAANDIRQHAVQIMQNHLDLIDNQEDIKQLYLDQEPHKLLWNAVNHTL